VIIIVFIILVGRERGKRGREAWCRTCSDDKVSGGVSASVEFAASV
jgi:hypothetical protein